MVEGEPGTVVGPPCERADHERDGRQRVGPRASRGPERPCGAHRHEAEDHEHAEHVPDRRHVNAEHPRDRAHRPVVAGGVDRARGSGEGLDEGRPAVLHVAGDRHVGEVVEDHELDRARHRLDRGEVGVAVPQPEDREPREQQDEPRADDGGEDRRDRAPRHREPVGAGRQHLGVLGQAGESTRGPAGLAPGQPGQLRLANLDCHDPRVARADSLRAGAPGCGSRPRPASRRAAPAGSPWCPGQPGPCAPSLRQRDRQRVGRAAKPCARKVIR